MERKKQTAPIPFEKDPHMKLSFMRNNNTETPSPEVIKTDRASDITAYILVIICGAIFVSLTFNNNIWLDEAFTASLVNTDMAGVIKRSMADTLPPLYNILLKLSTDIFGYRVPVMKITSAVPMILTMLLGATVVRRRFGYLTSYIFIIAITFMPNMFFYGVEIRMYSLGFMFATASGIYAYEVVCSPSRKNWCIFTAVSVLAGYSHHFAFVTVGFVYLYLLLYCFFNRMVRSFIKCLAATFILYFPCMLVTLKQLKSVSGYFSMPEVTSSVFIKYCRYPFTVGFTPLSILLLTVTLFLFLRRLFRSPKNTEDMFSLYCFLIYYGVLLFGTVVSKIMTANIFVDRYLFFALGPVWLFFAIETGKLTEASKEAEAGGRFNGVLTFLIILLELSVGVATYTNALKSEYAPGADEVIAFLGENVSKGDSLYTLEEYEELAYCLTFYDDRLTNYESLENAIHAAGGGTVWVAVMHGYETADKDRLPDGNEGYEAYIDEIENKGYSLESMGQFSFDRYLFRLYRLAGSK